MDNCHYYDIVVRFPSKEMADEFCGQMSDGFGEGFCDFSYWQETIVLGEKSKYEKVEKEGVPVYFVNEIFEL